MILCAFAVVVIVAYFGNQELYLSVDELVGNPTHYPAATRISPANGASEGRSGRRLQVRGVLEAESVEVAADGLEASFVLSGERHRLSVAYRGLLPDTFLQADTITVAGVVGADGVFEADAIAVQCPSKYEADSPPSGAEPVSPGAPANAVRHPDDG